MSKIRKTGKLCLTRGKSEKQEGDLKRKCQKMTAKGIFWKLLSKACKKSVQEFLQLYKA